MLLVAPLALVCAGVARGQTEKDLLAAFKESFAASDPAERAKAVTTLGDASRALPDQGTGKKVAQALAKGFEDDELEVCQASVFMLARRRDVDTAIGALETFLREQYKQLERRVESSDPYSKIHVERATCVFVNASHVLANYPDDRSAATLVALLANLKADTKKNDLGSRLVGGLAAASLHLGTLAAVETSVKQTKTFSGPAQAAGAKQLHDALSAFATAKGMTPPDFGEDYSAQWHAWLEANRNKLPAKLGKLVEPPKTDPGQPLHGLPGKSG